MPDSAAVVGDTLVTPADTLGVPTDSLRVPADTTARRPSRLPVGFAGPEPGLVVSGVPARAPVFHAAALLGESAGAFHYDLGVPGWADGVALGGLAPRRAALSLDGVPATDLFSGRPAFELLPLDVLAPLRLGPRYGSPVGVAASLRAYAASVPVTELRYRTGGDGIQFISATHAQTRRPGWVRRLGGDRARLQALFHVSGRRSDRAFAGFDVSGWQALGRLGIALPAFSLEVTERHGRDRAGAPGGVAPTGLDFDTVFDPDLATVLDPNAERETIRNDLAATLRLPLLAEPLTADGVLDRRNVPLRRSDESDRHAGGAGRPDGRSRRAAVSARAAPAAGAGRGLARRGGRRAPCSPTSPRSRRSTSRCRTRSRSPGSTSTP